MLVTIVALAAAAAAGRAADQSDAARVTFETARKLESVDGNLKGAIELYETVARSTDRAVAVKALMRMADAYQKLGDPEFRRTYERVVLKFGDQPEAADAGARLSAQSASPARRASGLICTDCVGPYLHGFALSPDGRWVSYADARAQSLMIRDVETGDVTRLLDASARYATWSPNARQIAYWWSDDV
jgi:hypothetical protein